MYLSNVHPMAGSRERNSLALACCSRMATHGRGALVTVKQSSEMHRPGACLMTDMTSWPPRMLCSALMSDPHGSCAECPLDCLAVLPRYLVDGHEPSYLAARARVVLTSSPRSITYKARLVLVLFGVLGIVGQLCVALLLCTACCAWHHMCCLLHA